jgi:hypothetical protein
MATKAEKFPRPVGVLARYLSMSFWRSKKLAKKTRGSRTSSTKARTYVALPPEGGWPGGMPGLATGLRSRGK